MSESETPTTTTEETPKKRRGFAAMPKEKVSEIASKGGKMSHQLGRAHKFTREEAVEAGRKGGSAPRRKTA